MLSASFEYFWGRPLGFVAPWPALLMQVLSLLVVPVGLGMWIRRQWPDAVDRLRIVMKRFSIGGLGVILVLVAFSDADRFLSELPATVPLAFLFVVASFAAGWIAGMLIRADARDRFTLAAEFATRNVAVATAIAVTLLGKIELATFATAYVLTEGPLVLAAALWFRSQDLGR